MSLHEMFSSGDHVYVENVDSLTIESAVLDTEQALDNAVLVLVGTTKTTAQKVFKTIRSLASQDAGEALANVSLVWFFENELLQYTKSNKFSPFAIKKSQSMVYLNYCGSNYVATDVESLPTTQFLGDKEVPIPVIPISDKALDTRKGASGEVRISLAACYNNVVLKSGESFKSPILINQLEHIPLYWLTMVAQVPNSKFNDLKTPAKNYKPKSRVLSGAIWSLLKFFSFLYFAAIILQHGIITPATEITSDCLTVDLPLILDYLHDLDYAGIYAARIQPLVDLARNTDYPKLWEDTKAFDFTSLARTGTWISFYHWAKSIYDVVPLSEECPIEYSTVQDLIPVEDVSEVIPYTKPVAIETILLLLSKTFTTIRGVLSYAAGLFFNTSN